MKISQEDFNAIAAECALEIASILKRNGIEVDPERIRIGVHDVTTENMPDFKRSYGTTQQGELIVGESDGPLHGVLVFYQEYQK